VVRVEVDDDDEDVREVGRGLAKAIICSLSNARKRRFAVVLERGFSRGWC